MSNRTTYTNADRERIAIGWRASGLDQNTYASQYGISARTLREWRAKRSPNLPRDLDSVRRVLVAALDALQAILAGLDQGIAYETEHERGIETAPEPQAPPAAPDNHEEPNPCQPGSHQASPGLPTRIGDFFADLA